MSKSNQSTLEFYRGILKRGGPNSARQWLASDRENLKSNLSQGRLPKEEYDQAMKELADVETSLNLGPMSNQSTPRPPTATSGGMEASESYYMPKRVQEGWRQHEHGHDLLEKGDFDGAIAAFREALTLIPEAAEAVRCSLGAALCEKGDLAHAISEYREALRINPDSIEPHVGLANALFKAGDPDSAKAQVTEALRLKPEDAFAHFLAGAIFDGLGDFDAAASAFRKSLSISPDSANARWALARTLKSGGRFHEASAEYRELLRLSPDDRALHDALAKLVGEGLVKLAEDLTETASKISGHEALTTGDTRKRILDELLCMNLAAVVLAPFVLPPEDERRDRILQAGRKALGKLITRRLPDTPILADYENRAKAYLDAYDTWHGGPGHAATTGRRSYDMGPGVNFALFCEPDDPAQELQLMVWGSASFMNTLATASKFLRDCLAIPTPGR